jgi:outer membrane protein TolC
MLHANCRKLAGLTALVLVVGLAGCTSPREYFRNGFKVGPSYGPPAAPLPKHWIDADDAKLRQFPCADISRWWCAFDDPLLNQLVVNAYRQNLTLREAGFRVLQARALRAIAVGNIFPQAQDLTGSYSRNAAGGNFFDNWSTNFNLSWELDFWGRFRRAVAAADDNLDASVADYDQVIVTLLGDVASAYVQIRTDQQRIKYLIKNAKLQLEVFDYISRQHEVGFRVSDLEYYQQLSSLRQTQSAIPQLAIDMRQAENRLCVLLGIPAVDLDRMLGICKVDWSEDEIRKISYEELDEALGRPNVIPKLPESVQNTIVINLPADLLRQRPDVRAAERRAAAQGEQIGIAQADLYPLFFVNGSLGYSAQNLSDLFKADSFNGSVGPSFQWNVLNYGRILNNVRLQDAQFRELVLVYQQTVLQADQEVENGIVTFLRSQQGEVLIRESAEAAVQAVEKAKRQYEAGGGGKASELTTYVQIQQNLVNQQDAWAQTQGQIAQGLIQVYRALGGGWEIRFAGPIAVPPLPLGMPQGEQGPVGNPNVLPPERIPAPNPNIPPVPVELPKPPDQP